MLRSVEKGLSWEVSRSHSTNRNIGKDWTIYSVSTLWLTKILSQNVIKKMVWAYLNKELIDKNGYKKYENTNKTKVVRRHIHEEWNEIFRKNRLSGEGKELYQKRKEHVERSFADSKQNHGYRYSMYKGVKKNQHYTWLICAAQNTKNIAIKESNIDGKHLKSNVSITDIINKTKPLEKI